MVVVEPEGSAGKAGIERGNVITAVDSYEIEDTTDLLAALRAYRPGDRVNLTIVDSSEKREVSVELA